MQPVAWVIGVLHRKRISCGHSQPDRVSSTFITIERLVSVTPLGRPLVPPV